MINLALYKYEMKKSIKMLFIFIAILTLYVSVIIQMYDPNMITSLAKFYEMMPDLMSSVGMKPGDSTLIGFMISYLYGFILIFFPMLFSIIRGHGLVSHYVDNGSMTTFLASSVKRSTICFTQAFVLLTGISFIVLYVTILEIVMIYINFPDFIDWSQLFHLNFGLFSLQLFIGGICFFCSTLFSDARLSMAFGCGIPLTQFIIRMLANTGESVQCLNYITFFSLFDPSKMAQGTDVFNCFIFFLVSSFLFSVSVFIFNRKDLHI